VFHLYRGVVDAAQQQAGGLLPDTAWACRQCGEPRLASRGLRHIANAGQRHVTADDQSALLQSHHGAEGPGKLNFGTSGQGSLAQLCGEYLKKRTGIDIVHVPYRGGAAAVQACIANEVQIVFGAESPEAVSRGELRGVAVLGTDRWDKMPDVPTTEESGLPGWALRSWHGVAVPAGTPPEIAQELNTMVNRIGALPAVATRFAMLGLRFQPQSLAELEARRRTDHSVFGSLIREAGLKPA
jgi:tripartite-type tricarboxylate transporter receptor subunit TctC